MSYDDMAKRDRQDPFIYEEKESKGYPSKGRELWKCKRGNEAAQEDATQRDLAPAGR